MIRLLAITALTLITTYAFAEDGDSTLTPVENATIMCKDPQENGLILIDAENSRVWLAEGEYEKGDKNFKGFEAKEVDLEKALAQIEIRAHFESSFMSEDKIKFSMLAKFNPTTVFTTFFFLEVEDSKVIEARSLDMLCNYL